MVLEWILAVGNYLNGQGVKGGAYGFKMDMIEKVNEVKSTDNKCTMMMYIIEKMEIEAGKELFDPNENLEDIDQLSKTPIS